MPKLFAQNRPAFVEECGKKIFDDGEVQVYLVYINNRIPVHVVMSDTVLECYRRESYGEEKVNNLTQATCQAFRFLKNDFCKEIDDGYDYLWLSLFFGGRALRMKHVFRSSINPNYDLPVLGLKPERVTSKSDESWDIRFWGAIREQDWDFEKLWWPMSELEKKQILENEHPTFKLHDIPDAFKELRFRFDKISRLFIPDGAYATGKSSVYSCTKSLDIMNRYGITLPSNVTMFGAYTSSIAIKKFYDEMTRRGLDTQIIVLGGIYDMSKKGIFPHLDDTDLSPISDLSIVCKRLYEYLLPRCTNRQGKKCRVCSCGDVGTSLDDWIFYMCELVTEMLMWDIPLELYGIAHLLEDHVFVEKLIKFIRNTQDSKNIRLVDVNGVYILDKINGSRKDKSIRTYNYVY